MRLDRGHDSTTHIPWVTVHSSHTSFTTIQLVRVNILSNLIPRLSTRVYFQQPDFRSRRPLTLPLSRLITSVSNSSLFSLPVYRSQPLRIKALPTNLSALQYPYTISFTYCLVSRRTSKYTLPGHVGPSSSRCIAPSDETARRD